MKVRQYVYLGVSSVELSPDDLTGLLGLEPDEVSARGSKKTGPPPLPRYNLWKLTSALPETACLDDHFASLFARIAGAGQAIRELASSAPGVIGVSVVRHFEVGSEDQDVLAARSARLPSGIEIVRGQHPLLGFSLGSEQIAKLASLGLGVDFDEYGDQYE